MATLIPMAADVAGVIGANAGSVENRSLLLDKFVMPKRWIDSDLRTDDAGRWSLLRLSEQGLDILRTETEDARRKQSKDNRAGENARAALQYLPDLVQTRCEAPDAQNLRAGHSLRFLDLVRDSMGTGAATFCARLEARLAINLSEGLIENAGISLDRLFGLPLIPGSALKGCARHAALAELKTAASSDPSALPGLLARFVAVFGCSSVDFDKQGRGLARFGSPADAGLPAGAKDLRGGVTFLPASPVTECSLEVDLTNVHTPVYYTGSARNGVCAGEPAALAEENPRPLPFPVVAPGAVFGFALALGPTGRRAADPARVLADARRWLAEALTVHGIGAKTGAGYGWFSIDEETEAALREKASRERQAAEARRRAEEETRRHEAAEAERRKALSPEDLALEELLAMDDQAFAMATAQAADAGAERQRALLRAFLDPAKRDKWKRWNKSKKPADAERVKTLRELAARHKINLP